MDKNSELPPVLYHYTSLDALVSILDTDGQHIKLRATLAKFFNDYQDCSYINDQIDEAFRRSKYNKEKKKKILNKLNRYKESFICCFSEKKDDLTMWRGYASNGLGVSIGLDFELLSTMVKPLQCSYDDREENIRLWQYMIEDELKKELTTKLFSEILVEETLSVKNPAYKEEGEWRICKYVRKYTPHQVLFRSTGKTIIPYIEHEIPKDFIREIIIGPCLNGELIKDGINLMLEQRRFDLSKIKVLTSKVPFRHL